ncbi:uncharacterized protein LOC105164926 [Sesamum indicum]|uniref:Uncharacterized protein LOC105164926 n=1 Tax=Sesamum indicum TaxID=4182 RepID=A0A6I9TBF7_SESIN|nr:uncharacterized protein LOC105164926 [Sesamum indicum]
MVDKSRKRKKGSISEEDVSTLLQRYSVNTVLALLQEVGQVAGENIDWHEMVKNTATGISGAREYQMLWRHLAYGETLIDQFDHDADLMDDDSDLEYELEAFPAVGREASAEAAACVKVLIASGYPNDTQLPNNSTIEAPLTINIPSSKALTNPSDSSLLANAMHGTNISIPVSVQKQPLSSGICGEKRPNNGTSGLNMPPRRKRRGWSTEEDMKLTAAVEKYGERNWANIARGDFKNDRKASELSQRWANLRKKQGNLKVGTSSQLSETQLAAAHRAMSLALNMPMGDNLKGASQISTVGMKSQQQSQKASTSPTDQQLGRAGPPKSQVPTKRPTMNPNSTPDSMVKAAAVAAGARIATSADASSLIEAARSQNVVHITTGGSSVMKSSTTSITNQLPSNVHFIRNGLAKAPISTYSAAKPNISRPGEAQQAQGHLIKPAASAVQSKPVVTATMLNVTSRVENGTASTTSITLPKTSEGAVVSASATEKQELLQRDQDTDQDAICCCDPEERLPVNQSAAPGNQSEVGKSQSSASCNAPEENTREDQTSISLSDLVGQRQDDQVALPLPEAEGNGTKNTENQFANKEIHDNPVPSERHEDLPSVDESEKSK